MLPGAPRSRTGTVLLQFHAPGVPEPLYPAALGQARRRRRATFARLRQRRAVQPPALQSQHVRGPSGQRVVEHRAGLRRRADGVADPGPIHDLPGSDDDTLFIGSQDSEGGRFIGSGGAESAGHAVWVGRLRVRLQFRPRRTRYFGTIPRSIQEQSGLSFPIMNRPSPPLDVPQPPYVVRIGAGEPLEGPLNREWLLTTGHGGFAMGTPLGINRRKYHALLVGTQRPPVERVALLNALDEEVTVGVGAGARTCWLATHRWADAAPPGFDVATVRRLVRFEKEPSAARWVYHVGPVEIIKELRLGWKRNGCAIRYTVRTAPGVTTREAVRVRVLPMVTIRDFHATLASLDEARYQVVVEKRSIRVGAQGLALDITCDHGGASQEVTVRRGIRYEIESDRHQQDTEDYFNPGLFQVVLPDGEGDASFTVSAALAPEQADPASFDDPARSRHLAGVRKRFLSRHPAGEPLLPLVYAADDFLVTRHVEGEPLMTVIAGYPWFGDWGRDTMISMAGLMLACGRTEDAMGCLRTFGAHVSRGMIPNRFDDYGGEPEYNTVDASLWFIHACERYVRESADYDGFRTLLKPACLEIVAHYISGTRDAIRMDPADALITAGDHTTQLTWMDAKRDGVVFTPRHGKAVEINALWHHALRALAGLLRADDPTKAGELDALADRARAGFLQRFWDPGSGRLWDCVQRGADGVERPVPELRPNMLLAVSLEHSPLSREQMRSVVACARRELLTPMGLRTLAPGDPGYKRAFTGDMMTRDAAYHNGTVWPWLIGPFAEAALRAEGFSEDAKARVRDELRPLVSMLSGDSLGQLFEVYDAEPRADGRRHPGGCMAQAWSVAELLRAALLSM